MFVDYLILCLVLLGFIFTDEIGTFDLIKWQQVLAFKIQFMQKKLFY